MLLLIDGDIVCYKAGFAALKGGDQGPEHAELCARMYIRGLIKYLKDYFEIRNVQVCLSGQTNFRFDVAVTQPYKGNRKASNKPSNYSVVRDYLINNYKATVVEDIEADDFMGILANQEPKQVIIASNDKDLRMIPGWHWEMLESRPPFYASDPGFLELNRDKSGRAKLFGTGIAWFCAQMLMGDRVDNIPGLPGYGDVKTFHELELCKTIGDYHDVIVNCYERAEAVDRMYEVEQLLWILREPRDLFRLKDLNTVTWVIGEDDDE